MANARKIVNVGDPPIDPELWVEDPKGSKAGVSFSVYTHTEL
jgi:hypothetical protein